MLLLSALNKSQIGTEIQLISLVPQHYSESIENWTSLSSGYSLTTEEAGAYGRSCLKAKDHFERLPSALQ